MIFRTLALGLILSTSGLAFGQDPGAGTVKPPTKDEIAAAIARERALRTAADEGIAVPIESIANVRGARSNKLVGFGIVVGLEGTGDTRSTPFTANLLANALTRWGTMVDAAQVRSKNIATVSITAELPPFAAPGSKVDITVQSIGDAKSLQSGFLLPTTLTSMSDPETVMVTGSGPVSIGGYNVTSGGSSVRKNPSNVGIIAGGGDIERGVQTQILFEGNKIYLDLMTPDFTTAERVANAIRESFPEFQAVAEDGVTIAVTVPTGVTAPTALSQILATEVKANTPASVVINERTGTVIVGGKVKLAPAVIVHGSLQIRIDTDVLVSQPAPFSRGETVAVEIPTVQAQESPTEIAVLRPNTTISDLAVILQTLKVSARDIIAIFQALSDQGALKAKIKVQ